MLVNKRVDENGRLQLVFYGLTNNELQLTSLYKTVSVGYAPPGFNSSNGKVSLGLPVLLPKIYLLFFR